MEPHITINGTTLTAAQAATVCVALGSFWQLLTREGLGEDAHGQRMTAAYLERLGELTALLRLHEPPV